MSLRFTTTHAPPGDNLIHFGDIVNSVYFIARGSIEILKEYECMAILGELNICVVELFCTDSLIVPSGGIDSKASVYYIIIICQPAEGTRIQ